MQSCPIFTVSLVIAVQPQLKILEAAEQLNNNHHIHLARFDDLNFCRTAFRPAALHCHNAFKNQTS
jgi:hypothetical protein